MFLPKEKEICSNYLNKFDCLLGKKTAGEVSLVRRPFNLTNKRKPLQQAAGTSAGKNQDTSPSSSGTLPGGSNSYRDPLPGTGQPRLPVNQLIFMIISYCNLSFHFYEVINFILYFSTRYLNQKNNQECL